MDESWRASTADFLLRQSLRGGEEAFVYCLVEHKRTDEASVMPQLLRYLGAILRAPRADSPRRRDPSGGAHHRLQRRETVARPEAFLGRARRHASAQAPHHRLRGGASRRRRRTGRPAVRQPDPEGGLLGLRVTAAPPAESGGDDARGAGGAGGGPVDGGALSSLFLAVSPRTARKVLRTAWCGERAGKESVMQSMSDYLESLGFRRGERKGLKLGLAKGLKGPCARPCARPCAGPRRDPAAVAAAGLVDALQEGVACGRGQARGRGRRDPRDLAS